MQNFETYFKNLLKAVKTEAAEEFDRNFERKGFFNSRWKETKHPVKRGSLMMRTGALRRGQRSAIQGDSIVFTNSQPHAAIHNHGGTITVTAAMKSFFWAMYYKNANQMTYSVKTRSAGNTKRNRDLSADAAYWKSLALMKVGSKLNILERRWIGAHPVIDEVVKKNTDAQIALIEKDLYNALKPRK